jgi:hypothetical protein
MIGGLLLALLSVDLFLLWAATRNRVCLTSMHMIKEGMTIAAVESAVGGPPGNHGGSQLTYRQFLRNKNRYLYSWNGKEGDKCEARVCEEGCLIVVYKNGQLIRGMLTVFRENPRGIFDRLGEWLGL